MTESSLVISKAEVEIAIKEFTLQDDISGYRFILVERKQLVNA